MKSIKADIDAVFTNASNALVAIEALRSPDEDILKAYYFRTLDLSGALLENERLKNEREAVAELKAKQEVVQSTIAAEPKKSKKVADAKMQTVKFAVTGTVEQLKALQKFLMENNIEYSPI